MSLEHLKNNKVWNVLGAILLALSVSFFLHLQSPKIADLDNLYHFRHAQIYQTEGLLNNSFPWVQYSVIRQQGADLWYGFHILLIPFTYLKDSLTGLKTASITITTIGILLIFFALKKLKIRWPYVWTIVFLISSPDLFYRFSALRPQLLSFGLSFLLFAYFIQPLSKNKSSAWIIFIISFLASWIHMSLSWIVLLILGLASLLTLFLRQKIKVKESLASFFGILIGLLLRPNFLHGLNLLYVQLVQYFIDKSQKIPLLWGNELLRFTKANFVDQFLPIVSLLIIFFVALYSFYFIKNREARFASADFKIKIWTSLSLSIFFLILAFSSTRRSSDYFFGFAVVIIALIFSHISENQDHKNFSVLKSLGAPTVILTCILFLYMARFTTYRYEKSLSKTYRPDRARGAAEWLAENSQTGDMVFHTRWEQFAELFFWNQKDYYINGMDPIFEYTYNPSLYWKHHFFSTDQATAMTCGAVRCKQEEAQESYKVLKEDFKASFVYIQKDKNPNLLKYLLSDQRFEKKFENEDDAVFAIK